MFKSWFPNNKVTVIRNPDVALWLLFASISLRGCWYSQHRHFINISSLLSGFLRWWHSLSRRNHNLLLISIITDPNFLKTAVSSLSSHYRSITYRIFSSVITNLHYKFREYLHITHFTIIKTESSACSGGHV